MRQNSTTVRPCVCLSIISEVTQVITVLFPYYSHIRSYCFIAFMIQQQAGDKIHSCHNSTTKLTAKDIFLSFSLLTFVSNIFRDAIAKFFKTRNIHSNPKYNHNMQLLANKLSPICYLSKGV